MVVNVKLLEALTAVANFVTDRFQVFARPSSDQKYLMKLVD